MPRREPSFRRGIESAAQSAISSSRRLLNANIRKAGNEVGPAISRHLYAWLLYRATLSAPPRRIIPSPPLVKPLTSIRQSPSPRGSFSEISFYPRGFPAKLSPSPLKISSINATSVSKNIRIVREESALRSYIGLSP